MTEVPLRRNRDFVLLQAGQLLSAIGSAATTVAYPLLTLALTHSPARAGWVTFARVIPSLLVSLPGGVAADRLNRKKLMIVSDTGRAAAVGSLAVTILLGDLRFWLIPVEGLPGWQIGALLAAFSACVLVGSMASGIARRVLHPRTLMLLELWAWLGPVLFLSWPSAYILAASILPVGLAIPVTDSVVVGYRLAITPNRMVGRVESVRSNIALALAPFGALTAGLLLNAVTPRMAILAFATVALPLALWGTLSPVIRNSRPGDPQPAEPASARSASS